MTRSALPAPTNRIDSTAADVEFQRLWPSPTPQGTPPPPTAETIPDTQPARSGVRRFLWENGLSLTFLLLFVGFWFGQSLTGMYEHNQTQAEHGEVTVTYWQYLRTGHFVESTAENWESEFLQMGAFVLLTVWLRQKGSAESKDPDADDDPSDNDPALSSHDPKAPWPVRRGGFVLWLYSHSLSLTFLVLFLISFAIHAVGGAVEYSDDQRAHGQPEVTVLQYMGTSRFWFESLQNWQSEFLSLFAMVVLSIFLREKGSAESKPVDAPHHETGH